MDWATACVMSKFYSFVRYNASLALDHAVALHQEIGARVHMFTSTLRPNAKLISPMDRLAELEPLDIF